MINDYFGRTAEARKHYEVIVNEESLEMSFRALQVITNFYIRSGEQEKAVALVNKYTDDKLMLDMLNKLANDVRRADPQTTAKSSTVRSSACPKPCSALRPRCVRGLPALTLPIYSSAYRFTQIPNMIWPNCC